MPKSRVERVDFRKWFGDRLEIFAKKKAFKEDREPRNDDEREELAQIVASIWQRSWLLSYAAQPKQQLFHDSRVAQIRGIWAPNQRGKTTAGLAELLSWGFGEEPWSGRRLEKIGKTNWRPRMRFFVGAKDFGSGINEVILPKMNELLPLEELGVEFTKMSGRITHKLTFPEPYCFSIKFLSYDQEKHKNEGMTWNGGWFDEPPPHHLYVSCRRGCIRHAAPIIFTGTPISEPWMYDDIYAHKKSVHIETASALRHLTWDSHAVIKVNHDEYPPGITKEQIDAYADTLDEDEKRSRIFGEFFTLQGRVYKNFVRATPPSGQVLDRDAFFVEHKDWRDYPAFHVVDPHDRKPFAMAWGVLTPRDEIVFIDEWPNVDFFKQKSWRWSLDEYADMFRTREQELWQGKQDSIVWRIMDPNFGKSTKAGLGGRTLQEEFIDRGFNFDTEVRDNIDEGHMVVKSDLFNQRLFVLSHMHNMIKSAENYTWDEYSGSTDRAVKEKPRDKFKDFMDLWRYICVSDLHYMAPGALMQQNPWSGNGLG